MNGGYAGRYPRRWRASSVAWTEGVWVTEWAFEPGAATGWHRHDFDYVIIPVIGGVVEIEDGAGKRTPFEMVAGVSYFRKAGVAHDVINGPGGELRFVRNDHPSMKMHDRHIVGRAGPPGDGGARGSILRCPYSPEMGPGHHHIPKMSSLRVRSC